MYYFIGFGHFGLGRLRFTLVLITSPYNTLLLHWFRTRWIWKVLFSLRQYLFAYTLRTSGRASELDAVGANGVGEFEAN